MGLINRKVRVSLCPKISVMLWSGCLNIHNLLTEVASWGNVTICEDTVLVLQHPIKCITQVKFFFGKTPLFFRYSGVNAANATNFLTKRR